MSTRIVREMLKMLASENRLDRKLHKRALILGVYSSRTGDSAGVSRIGGFPWPRRPSAAAKGPPSARYDISHRARGPLAQTEKVAPGTTARTRDSCRRPPSRPRTFRSSRWGDRWANHACGACFTTGNLVGLDAEGEENAEGDSATATADVEGAGAEAGPMTTMLRGDASHPSALNRCARAVPEGYDVIVDGGSRWSSVPAHQLSAFRHLFPSLKPGGVYIVEGVESSYWGAGSRLHDAMMDGTSLVEVFKAHLDNINSEFSGRQAASLGFDHEIEMVAFAHNCIVVTRGRKQDVDFFSWRRYRWDDRNGEEPNYAIAASTTLPRDLAFSDPNRSSPPRGKPPLIVFARRYVRLFQFFNALRHEAHRHLDRDFVRVFDARALDAALSACGSHAVVVAFHGSFLVPFKAELRYFSRAVGPVLRKHSARGCSLVIYETEPLEVAQADGSTAQRAALLRDRYAVWGVPSPTVWVYSHRARRELTDLGLDRLGLRAVTYLPPGYSAAYDYRRHPQRSEHTRCSPVGIYSAVTLKGRLGDESGDALPEAVLISDAWSDADWAATAGSHHSAVNLHRTASVRSLEAFRLSPLLASGLLVVSEHSDPEDERAFEGLVHFAPRHEVAGRSARSGRPPARPWMAPPTRPRSGPSQPCVSDDFRRRFNLTGLLLEALREVESGTGGSNIAGPTPVPTLVPTPVPTHTDTVAHLSAGTHPEPSPVPTLLPTSLPEQQRHFNWQDLSE